jgi:hypothetical protein
VFALPVFPKLGAAEPVFLRIAARNVVRSLQASYPVGRSLEQTARIYNRTWP